MASREQLLQALQTRRALAGVIVKAGWIDEQQQPRGERVELWLSHRIQPASAGRLRMEISISMLQVHMKAAAAAAGPFASVMLEARSSTELGPAASGPRIRYLYEIESGRAMTAVQQSVRA